MKKQRHILKRLLGVALALVMTVALAVPASSGKAEAADKEPSENLTITINNAAGLPKMQDGQFSAYQIFSGTPNWEGDPGENVYNAENWNNYTLADIQWGDALKNGPQLVYELKSLDFDTYKDKFPEFFTEQGVNRFTLVNSQSAESLAKFLAEHNNNAFLQEFCRFVVYGTGSFLNVGHLNLTAASKSKTDIEGTKSTINVSQHGTGYYLIVENRFTQDGEAGIEDGAVSEFILAVLGAQEIDLKASIPTVDKSIVLEVGDAKGDTAGYGGSIVFELTGTVAKNIDDFLTYYYLFTDMLSPGLSYDDHLEVRIVKEDGTQYTVDPAEYSVTIDPEDYSGSGGLPTAEGTSIKVEFSDLLKKNEGGLKYNASSVGQQSGTVQVVYGDTITVTYQAILNKNAQLGSAGNPNDVDLTYSNDPNSDEHGKTPKKEVWVYSFGLNLHKVGTDKDHAMGLEGAGFILSSSKSGMVARFEDAEVEGKSVRKLVEWVDESMVMTLVNAYADAKKNFDNATNAEQAQPDGTAYTALQDAKDALKPYLLNSDTEGNIPFVYGIDEGEYTLTEVVTPDGYNTMKPFTFKIEAEIDDGGKLTSVSYYAPSGAKDPTATYDATGTSGSTEDEKEFFAGIFASGLLPETLENQKAPFLPFTGGIGTVIFYVTGGLLIAGAVTYFVVSSKKRKKAEQAK